MSATACEKCAQGTYSNEDGSTVCKTCPSGQTTTSTGAVECFACPPGRYLNQTTRECTNCEPDTFAELSGLTVCFDCAFGTVAPELGSITCTACPAGRYREAIRGVVSCAVCRTGEYGPGSGLTTCYTCPKGRFSQNEGQVACDECPRGRYNPYDTSSATELGLKTRCFDCEMGKHAPNREATACDNCTLGLFAGDEGKVECEVCPGGRYNPGTSFDYAKQCKACEPGRYAPQSTNGTGISSCMSCASGTVSVEGAVDCTPCAAGRYVNATTYNCDPCPVGRFSNSTSTTACQLCETGTISSSAGAVSCSTCAAGRYASSILGAIECFKCPIGFITAEDGQTQCQRCSNGSTADLEGSVQCSQCAPGRFQNRSSRLCEACPAGRFSNLTAATTCIDCAVGSISSVAGSVSCSACAAGRYATSTMRGTTCQPCSLGTFTSLDGQTSCEPCASGSSNVILGSVQCSLCPAGRFQNQTSGECERCALGRFTSRDGLTVCSACGAGSFSSVDGAVSCVACPAGRFSNSTGAPECETCPVHSFAASAGLTSCTPCTAVSKYSYANRTGSQFCDQCSKQEYLIFTNRRRPNTFRGCLLCPGNADCSSGEPLADAGYWINADLSSGAASVFVCSNPSACPGDGRCGPNRLDASENPLCASCVHGFQEWGNDCIPCTETNVAALIGVMMLVLAFVQAFLFMSQGGSAYVGVTSYFVQTVILLIGSQTNAGISTILSLFNLDAFAATSGSSSCLLNMSDELRAASGFFGSMFAFVCWVVLFLLWRVVSSTRGCPWPNKDGPSVSQRVNCCNTRVLIYLRLCYTSRTRSFRHDEAPGATPPVSQKPRDITTYWLRTPLALFLFTINSVGTTAFSIFNCIDVTANGETVTVVEAFPTVGCDSTGYNGIRALAIVMCMLYIAIPLVLIARFPTVLLPQLKVLNKCCSNESLARHLEDKSSASTLYILGALTAPYRWNAAWWQLVVITRRLLLVIVVVFTPDRG
jgi:Tyrosine-protein kinase ephrin type A/B receptor-like